MTLAFAMQKRPFFIDTDIITHFAGFIKQKMLEMFINIIYNKKSLKRKQVEILYEPVAVSHKKNARFCPMPQIGDKPLRS